MNAGELISDDMVESVVRNRLDDHDWNYGFVIDGFPRNGPQAEFFLESYDIDGVLHLEMPDAEVHRRGVNRRADRESGGLGKRGDLGGGRLLKKKKKDTQ